MKAETFQYYLATTLPKVQYAVFRVPVAKAANLPRSPANCSGRDVQVQWKLSRYKGPVPLNGADGAPGQG